MGQGVNLASHQMQGVTAADQQDGPDADADKQLIVTVPVKELPFGGNTTQATAKLKDGSTPPVVWTIDGIGSISPDGVYKSPDSGTAPSTVKIIATLKTDPTVSGDVSLDVVPASLKPTLTVTTPSPEIRAGEEKMQATAKLNTQTTPPVVTWTIMGPAGRTENGSIDASGVYTSPKANVVTAEFPLVIKATLVSDPSIFGTTTIKVLPNEKEIFTKCTQGGTVLPIVADVYEINENAGQIPTNATLHSATLQLQVTNLGNSMNLHRMLAGWAATDTWTSLTGGVQNDGVEAVVAADVASGAAAVGVLSINVLTSLQAWLTAPTSNRGWVLLPTGTDGVDFASAEGAPPPKLMRSSGSLTISITSGWPGMPAT